MEPGTEDKKMQEIYDQLDAALNSARPRVEPTFLLTYNCKYLANGKGTFDQIISGLLKAKEYGMPIIIRCNIEIDEDGQVDQLLQALERTGLKEYEGFQLYIAPVANTESKYTCSHDFLKEYLKQVETHLENPVVMKEILRKIHKVATNFLNPESMEPYIRLLWGACRSTSF